MKNNLLILVAILLSYTSFSQAPIPFSWTVPNTTLPTGVTMGITAGGATYAPGFYANNGNTSAPSVKLSGTGHFLKINIVAEGGEVSYYLKGQAIGASYLGTLKVLMSADDITYDTVRTIKDAQLSGTTYTQFKDTCKTSTRYIKFYYFDKISGYNVSIDDIDIGSPLAKPEAEINALIGTDTIFSGGKYYTSETVGNTKRINLIIENQGTDSTLKLTSVLSSNSTEFSVVSSPLSISSLSSDTIKIDFTPSAAGTRNSTITIANNDSTENPYIIDFIGYGNGLATEPSTPSAVTFSNISTYKYGVSITPNTPLADESYLVLFKNGSAPTGTPVDGMSYTPGDVIGNAKVAYVGKNLSYLSKETYANSTYHVAVYSYSGTGTFSNYNSTARTANLTTPVTMMASNYYNGISTSATTFVSDLQTKINPHTLRFYGDFDDTYIDEFASRDTSNGQQVVTCVYTGDEYIYTAPFTFTYISREHSFPQSWMPTYGDQTKPEYSDYHNLYPTNQNNANAVRSNRPLGEVVNVTSTFLDGTYGTDARGKAVYEPRDEHKGNAARAIFYMCATYEGVSGNSWALPNPIDAFIVNYEQEQDVLKKWHWQDPVDEKEMARNDYIESLQNNRNPFIDSMSYVCYIDFMTMTWLQSASPCLTTPVSLEEMSNLKQVSLYPNPANNSINLIYSLNESETLNYEITNSIGQTVASSSFNGLTSDSKSIKIDQLSSGMYQIRITGSSFNETLSFIKN
ncbi:MAG: endonuclease [Flavobacteriales bacterium]